MRAAFIRFDANQSGTIDAVSAPCHSHRPLHVRGWVPLGPNPSPIPSPIPSPYPDQVTGKTMAENLAELPGLSAGQDVIGTFDKPVRSPSLP